MFGKNIYKTVPQIFENDGELIGGYTELWELVKPVFNFEKLEVESLNYKYPLSSRTILRDVSFKFGFASKYKLSVSSNLNPLVDKDITFSELIFSSFSSILLFESIINLLR